MLEDAGHWLKLMRTATLPTDGNICLRISGRDIFCTVTKDVNKEVELKVTCRIADPCREQKFDQSPLSENERLKSPEAPKHTEVGLEEQETVPNDCTSPKAMLDCVSNRVCTYSDTAVCRSSYNSREVSEERSFKLENCESDIDMDEFKEEVSSSTAQESPSSDRTTEARIKSDDEMSQITFKNNESEIRNDKFNDSSVLRRSPAHEFANTESYFYEKNSRLPPHSPNSTRSASGRTNPKAFCEACKIQFMSVNTYQVHKSYYCKSRHESEDFSGTMPILDAASGELSAAFKPSADTVILRGGINGGIVPSVIQPQAIYAAISTNPLILLPCTLIPGQGLVPQNGVIPIGAPGIVMQSAAGCPSTVKEPAPKSGEIPSPPRKTSHPVMNTGDKHNDNTLLSSSKIAALKRKISEGEVLNLKKTCTTNESHAVEPEKYIDESKDIDLDQDSPLDLSVKVKIANDMSDRKSPLKRRSSVISLVHPPSPVLRVCGSSSPPGPSVISSVHSVPSPTHSYSNDSPCHASQVPVVVHRASHTASDRISPLPPVLQSAVVDKPISAPGMLPPKLMKQGNNVCDECHIVFIKYDNLVTHKKHYCAYRRRQLSAMAAAAAAANQEQSSDDNNSNHSGINEGIANFQTDESKSGMRKIEYGIEHYRQVLPKPPQYLCDACGVRFSTSDTLVAHQTYYCMKKPDSAMAKASSNKGDDACSSNVDSPFSGPEEWKCNYCDATCSSYDTIRRHLSTHSEPRGYRCLLCGYKGNTLRGMRTHACEHLTEDTTSIEEFMSSTIIGETGIIPIIQRTLECSDEDSDHQRETTSYRKRERTSSNNSDISKDRSFKQENLVSDYSESEEMSDTQKNVEIMQKDSGSKRIGSVKTESSDSSSDVSGNQESVNPLAFCDVVIKSENDHNVSGDDSDRNEVNLHQERDCDSDEQSPASQPRSVICVAERVEYTLQSPKRKSKSQTKSNSDLKSCKSCGVSFQHMSNLLTHKKYYCVSRSLRNCVPEQATVQ